MDKIDIHIMSTLPTSKQWLPTVCESFLGCTIASSASQIQSYKKQPMKIKKILTQGHEESLH